MHEQTVGIVDAQVKDIANQMQALDEFVMRARTQNDYQHEFHTKSLDGLADKVRSTYASVRGNLNGSEKQSKEFQEGISRQKATIQKPIDDITENIRAPLQELQSNIRETALTEYTVTGNTPKKTIYDYPTCLPETEDHETLLNRLKGPVDPSPTPLDGGLSPVPDSSAQASPTKTVVYNDCENEVGSQPTPNDVQIKPTSWSIGLREIDVNVARPLVSNANEPETLTETQDESPTEKVSSNTVEDDLAPPPKRLRSSSDSPDVPKESKLPQKPRGKKGTVELGLGVVAEGNENIPVSQTGRNRVSSRGRRLRGTAR